MAVSFRSDMEAIFTSYYRNSSWGEGESRSGPGSSLEATRLIRNGLAEWFDRLDIRSLVDAPCGDMHWMQALDYRFSHYVGIDIVPEAIARLRQMPFPPGYRFQCGDITADVLPAADALLCRDCLVHLPYAAIRAAIETWRKSDFRYLITTTFPRHANEDCALGQWRPLNLQAAPFAFPDPIGLIWEMDQALDWEFNDKALGIWYLAALEGAQATRAVSSADKKTGPLQPSC